MLTSCQHMRQMELVQEIGGREWSVALFTAKINIPNQFYNLVCGHKIFLFSFFENDIMCKHEMGKIFILDFRMFHLLLVFLISQTVLQLDTFTQKCSQIISYTPECIFPDVIPSFENLFQNLPISVQIAAVSMTK